MDRTGDAVELLVEHATDFRMCDLLDDPGSMNPGSSGGSGPNCNLRKSTEDSTSGLAPGNIFFFFPPENAFQMNSIIPMYTYFKCYMTMAHNS